MIIKEVFQETPVRGWRSKTGKGRRSVKGAAPGRGPRKVALVQGGSGNNGGRIPGSYLYPSILCWEGHRPRRCLPSEGSLLTEPQVQAVRKQEPCALRHSGIQGSGQRTQAFADGWKLGAANVHLLWERRRAKATELGHRARQLLEAAD